MPAKFPRASRVVTEETIIPGITRITATHIREELPFDGTLAEGTNPPRDPTKRSSTREETAPLD